MLQSSRISQMALRFVFLSSLLSSVLGITACKSDQITDTEGQVINFDAYRGRCLLISYWADWCSSCVKEIKVLNELQARYPKTLQILGVNVDHLSLVQLQILHRKLEFSYPNLIRNPNIDLGYKMADHIPYLVLIGPKGQVLKTLQGTQSLHTLETLIKKAIQ